MCIAYNDMLKELPNEPLHRLFVLAGWSDGKESEFQLTHFNAPFIHSTLVISAWDGDTLVGVVRALSDTITRAVIYDLVVDPAYRGRGIGRTLVHKCIEKYPQAEWLLQTIPERVAFYGHCGFKPYEDIVLSIPSSWF